MKFDRTADKHGVPRRSTWEVTMKAPPVQVVTNWEEPGWLYRGVDDRGVEIEVITVQRGQYETVVHAMPTSFRHRPIWRFR